MELLVDVSCLTQPPTKSYWIATTQRHLTSERSGKEKRCKLVCEKPLSKNALSEQALGYCAEPQRGGRWPNPPAQELGVPSPSLGG